VQVAAAVAATPTSTVRSVSPWRDLYRVGAMSAIVYVALVVAAIVLDTLAPPPVTGGRATLDFITDQGSLYVIGQYLWLLPGIFGILVFLALFPALRQANPSWAAIGSVLGAASWALALAIPTTSRGAPALAVLAEHYAAAPSAAERAAFATAAETLIAQNNTVMLPGVLSTVAILIVGLVMLRGDFPRPVAVLGVATGLVGMASEALRFALPAAFIVYGLLLLAWFGAVAWMLLELSTRASRGDPVAAPASIRGAGPALGRGR
jgi:hypothetical protein